MTTIRKIYEFLIKIGKAFQSPLLLILRLYWGWLLYKTGLEKLVDINPFTTYLTSLGFPLAYAQAYIAAFFECGGGLCLMVGFASRLMAIPIIITLLVAYITAHREVFLAFFSHPQEFTSESPFMFILVALLVFAFGPGKFSIDHLIQHFILKKSK